MKSLPFRLRLALLSALISGVVLAVFGTTAWYMMYRERRAGLDRELRALAYRHPGWMNGRASYEQLSRMIELVFGSDRKEQLILMVTGRDGRVRYRSPHWPAELDPATLDLTLADNPRADPPPGAPAPTESADPQAAPPRGPPWAAGAAPRGRYGPGGPAGGWPRGNAPQLLEPSLIPRFQTVRLPHSTWRLGIFGNADERLVLGINFAEARAELDQLRNIFLLVLPLALLLVAGGGWWIAGRAMRPLRSITETVERVTARGLDQRIPPSREDPEIAHLIRVFNGMMDRLEKSFRQTIRFSADASHELKTPLAIMQGELENALQAAAPGSREQQVFANLLEETQRLKSITRGLLLLARADAGRLPVQLQPVCLSDELVNLSEDVETMAHEEGLRCERQITPGIRVPADWGLLRQAVFNLLHNAIRYNEPGGRLGMTLTARDGRAELEVWNEGPGIPEADQPRLFDRFYRVDAARSRRVDGVGLGLSLAHEIVRAHGGVLELKESRPGYTCFRLSLPLLPA
jgi:heavy metal sensor kinase